LFPTAAADYLEYERFGLINAIAHFIDAGRLKVFSINSINKDSWLNPHVAPPDRALQHQRYNEYVVREVVPFLRNHCSQETPIVTAGASFGALHAANTFFRRPDVFDGVIAMSGSYDIKSYSNGYYDDNCYFNSPVDYLPNLTDEFLLGSLRSKHHIHILTGQGAYEAPAHSIRLSQILSSKSIPHQLDLWGYDVPHEWPTWLKMLPHVLGTCF
jgi:esterase/lipase superfamily enzyme